MATDLCQGVFQPNFAKKKRLKMTKFSNVSQSLKINVKVVKYFRRDFLFYVLVRKVIYIWVGLPDFRER